MRIRQRGNWVCGVVVGLALTAFGNGAPHSPVGAGGEPALAQGLALPQRPAPALLSKQDVPPGLTERLRQMHDRCAAYQARRRDGQRRLGRSPRITSVGVDLPRQPEPATPPRSLEP
jgi:hypothetical protein